MTEIFMLTVSRLDKTLSFFVNVHNERNPVSCPLWMSAQANMSPIEKASRK